MPIVVLSQLKRDLEYRADKRPLCCDIRGYTRNQNAADNILFLFRENYYIHNDEPRKRRNETDEKFNKRPDKWIKRERETANLCEIIVAKNSNGYYGYVEMHFDWETGLFWEEKEE